METIHKKISVLVVPTTTVLQIVKLWHYYDYLSEPIVVLIINFLSLAPSSDHWNYYDFVFLCTKILV